VGSGEISQEGRERLPEGLTTVGTVIQHFGQPYRIQLVLARPMARLGMCAPFRKYVDVFEDRLTVRGALRAATGSAWEHGVPTAAPDADETSPLRAAFHIRRGPFAREKIWRLASAMRDGINETQY
jgi:hypothetical protein